MAIASLDDFSSRFDRGVQTAIDNDRFRRNMGGGEWVRSTVEGLNDISGVTVGSGFRSRLESVDASQAAATWEQKVQGKGDKAQRRWAEVIQS